jgi:hypothetical protein
VSDGKADIVGLGQIMYRASHCPTNISESVRARGNGLLPHLEKPLGRKITEIKLSYKFS